MTSLNALECLVVCMVTMLLWQQTKITMRSSLSWEELLSALEPVAMANIAHLALEYSHPAFFPLRTEVDRRWQMVGGARGLWKIRSNAQILFTLAACAEHWVPQASRSLASSIRGDALALRSLTAKLLILRILRPFPRATPVGVERAATLYLRQIETLSSLFKYGPSGSQHIFEVIIWHPV